MSQNVGKVFLFINDNSKTIFLTRLSYISRKISLCSEETHPTIREFEAVEAKPIWIQWNTWHKGWREV